MTAAEFTLMACSILAPITALAEGPPEAKWDIASLARIVQPMKHDMKGRLPLILWNFPLPRNDQAAKMREDGSLRKAIDVLAERGIVPTVELGWEWTPAGAMAMARTLDEAGCPVFILQPDCELLEKGAWAHCTVWGEGPDATRKNETRKWPCLPLADPRDGAERVRKMLQPFKEAGIRVAGVWFDDEALPHPWNGCFEAQRKSEECRKHYPPGVLDDFKRFNEWTYALRSRLIVEIMARPVRELFPNAIVGNYGEFASSAEMPFEGLRPPRKLDPSVPLMPSAYANTNLLPRHFKPDEPVTQEKADAIYFFDLMRTVSTCNANRQPGQLSIPFLSRYTPDNPDPRFLVPMSQRAFREVVWHTFLRGAATIYVFNLGYPTRPQTVTPALSFESVEDVRSVYDALLAHREFLDKGEPVNFRFPPLFSAEPVWSGLRLGDRCLVRTFTLGAVAAKVEVTPFPGVTLTLDAPPEGALLVVHNDGRVRRL
ncbi:MAG TPA: hypothetical protein PLE19_09905 [Planctomycetota bacterium]|nr:hypothetical protein [Planctomycetota bacterium]HRR79228.1 hypothetical protein [Planctomycetota bacterium]HRT94271.1 hypothetical protein [Planctomycetota bacterium]